jgi:hypothetical protein
MQAQKTADKEGATHMDCRLVKADQAAGSVPVSWLALRFLRFVAPTHEAEQQPCTAAIAASLQQKVAAVPQAKAWLQATSWQV